QSMALHGRSKKRPLEQHVRSSTNRLQMKRPRMPMAVVEARMVRKWDEMDHDILVTIMKYMVQGSYLVRGFNLYKSFIVCKSWRSAVLDSLFPPGNVLDLCFLKGAPAEEKQYYLFYLKFLLRRPHQYTKLIIPSINFRGEADMYIAQRGEADMYIAQRLPKLKCIVQPTCLLPCGLKRLIPYWPELNEAHCHAALIPLICKHCKNIKRLDLSGRIGDDRAYMLASHFPQLMHLKIDDKVEDVPLVTLTDVMTYPQVTGNYKCIVRVVAALPWTIQDFRSPDGTYRIRLTLEDPTGRIHAYLYAEDGEVFFEGNPPMDALIRKWNTLLGVAEVDSGGVIENAPRNPPWVLCCIKSYYFDKNDVWGSRKWTWSTRNFSYAGRVKLIETVFLSLHIYWAQIMVLPKKVLKDVEQACINFLWHGSDLKQSPNLVAWKEVCKSKKEGGLNIRDIHSWNIAAMGKHVWAISTICG
uniref:POT1A/B-like OB fold domain-containing protein n=1 Tax=Chenopodium quinoa TaxID=63459 RepID=A0A803LIZ8_CHEQI